MTQETPNPESLSDEEIIQLAMDESGRGDPRVFMWLVLRNGMLDQVAPLDTERGIDMRLQLAGELAKSALLLAGGDFITEEEGNRITNALHEFEREVVEAGRELGMDLPDPPDPADFGI